MGPSLREGWGHVVKGEGGGGLMGGPHCTGNTGKMTTTKSLSGKTQAIWKFVKTQGIWFAQVVNSLGLKVNDISKPSYV